MRLICPVALLIATARNAATTAVAVLAAVAEKTNPAWPGTAWPIRHHQVAVKSLILLPELIVGPRPPE